MQAACCTETNQTTFVFVFIGLPMSSLAYLFFIALVVAIIMVVAFQYNQHKTKKQQPQPQPQTPARLPPLAAALMSMRYPPSSTYTGARDPEGLAKHAEAQRRAQALSTYIPSSVQPNDPWLNDYEFMPAVSGVRPSRFSCMQLDENNGVRCGARSGIVLDITRAGWSVVDGADPNVLSYPSCYAVGRQCGLHGFRSVKGNLLL